MSSKLYLTLYTVLGIILLSIITPLALATQNTPATRNSLLIDKNWEKKIPKELLESYDEPVDIKVASTGFDGKMLTPLGKNLKPVMVHALKDALSYIRAHSTKIRYVIPLPNGAILAYILASKEQVIELAKSPLVVSVQPSPRIDEIIGPSVEKVKLASRDSPSIMQAGGEGDEYFAGVKLIGAVDTWKELNITGKGVVVGVVDTGVDFAHPDLGSDAIARDENGIPLLITMDEYFVYTRTVAVRNETGYLNTTNATVVFYSTLWSGIFGQPVFLVTQLDHDWYIGNITSQSGIYKIGIAESMYIDWVTGYIYAIRVPVVAVDTQQPGVYDTLIFDLSTTFYEFSELMRMIENQTLGTVLWREPDPSWLDYSFADEPLITYGNEIIARDFDGDGLPDFSLGALAGYYLDTWGLATSTIDLENGYIYLGTPGEYPGFDSNGGYFVFFTDFYGHGTSVATVIAARGNVEYYPYGGETPKKLYGVAPDAKLAAGYGWWFGDLLGVEYWLAGWDWVYDPNMTALIPVPTGTHRADVVSNSWSYVNVARWAHQFPGSDYYSTILDNIVLGSWFNGNPVTIVFAAGNEGPGYSSVGSPGTGSLIIEVGASTIFDYYQVFGYPPGYADDIIPFSSRGPTALGYPRPDVVAMGAYEWAGVRTLDGRGYGIFGASWYGLVYGLDLFGGTSEATPFTSGTLALAVQAFREKYNTTPSPVLMKILLKSAADDIGYPGLQQGSGRINAYKLVKEILEDDFIAYIPEGIRNAFYENYYNLFGDDINYILPLLYDTAYYAVVTPGTSTSFNLVIEGTGDVALSTETYVKAKEVTLWSGVYDFNHTEWIPIPNYLLNDVDYIEIFVVYGNLTYQYPYFGQLPSTQEHLIRIDALDVVNGLPYRLNTEARYSTNALLTIGNVQERIKGTIYIRLRPYSTGELPTPVKAKVIARMYKKVECGLVAFNTTSLYVNGSAVVPVTVTVPENFAPGVVDFKIIVSTPTKKIVLPASIVVPIVLDDKSSVFLGARKSSRSYDPYTPWGLVDPFYGTRTEALDWRMIPVVVTDPSIAGLAVIARWSSGYATSLEMVVVPPGGPFLPDGRDQSFAAFKLVASNGYVYNPSLSDQLHGRLRMFIPVKWALPLRDFTLWYYYGVAPSDEDIGESFDYIYYYKPEIQPGIYRIFIAYGSYSGLKTFDPIGLRILVIRTVSRSAELSNGGYSVYAEFTAPGYAPFLFASLYVFNSTPVVVSGGIYTYAVLGVYGVYSNGEGSASILHYSDGFLLDYSASGTHIAVKYLVMPLASGATEINTVLLTWGYPWHASGFYYYNMTGSSLVIGELVYEGAISASTTIGT